MPAIATIMSKQKLKYWFWLLVLLLTHHAEAGLVGRHEGARELLLSGDGKIAFSIGQNDTRVWDVENKRELEALPVQASNVVAVAEDGRRVLCRHSVGKAEKRNSNFTLWRRRRGHWQMGTQVRKATTQPLLDAVFVDGELVLLWQQSIEQRGTSGKLRRTIHLKEMSNWPYRDQVSPGALSSVGTRAIVSGFFGEQPYAVIYDISTGRPVQKIELDDMAWRTAWNFSPDTTVVGAVIGKWVEPWNPSDGPQPAQFTRSLWNVATGQWINDSSSLALTFWPNQGRTLLVQPTKDAPWKLELYDVSTRESQPLPFPQLWKKRTLKEFRFSHDGRSLVALDEYGDIWEESMRPEMQSK